MAPRAEAARSSCDVGTVNWVSIAPPGQAMEVEVQVRYRSAPERALLTPLGPPSSHDRGHRCRLDFVEQQFSITPGQAAVFYAGEVLLGGGLIELDHQ